MMRTAVEGVPLVLYLAVSGALFLLGLLGVMTRRNPLLLLLAVELLLNSANLAPGRASAATGTSPTARSSPWS